MSARSPVSIVFIVGLVLYPLMTGRSASGEWPECGRAISSPPGGQMRPSVATDGVDGAVIAWQDLRSPRVNIFAQRVLASGEVDPAWPTDGRALLTDSLAIATADGGQNSPRIVPDGAGGAIVVWQDDRDPLTGTDLYAQHVWASGAVDGSWPANGAAVCAFPGLQNTFVVLSDGDGGVIAAWVDTRAGGDEFDIFAQHLRGSGIVDERWPAGGLAVCNVPGPQGFPAIAGDGQGGAIITWHDQRAGSAGFDVYAQHVLNRGVADPGWPAAGRAVCYAEGDQGRPTITPDGAGGALVAWSDSRIVGTSHIFAHHVLGSGTVDPCWPTNGLAISDPAASESRPLAIPDGAGGAIVTWQAFSVGLNMYAQHVTAGGVVDPLWPTGGKALSNRDRLQTQATIVTDGEGGAIIAWRDSVNIVAQHVLASGALDHAYPDTGLVVCDLPSPRGSPAMIPTSGGGAILAWTDGRSGIDADIYATQVLVAETLDVPESGPGGGAFLRAVPNPARGSLSLRFAVPGDGVVKLTVYDVAGRRVRGLTSGERSPGEQAIAWDLRDDHGHVVDPGIYFARLDVDGRSVTRKIVALR